MRFIVQIITTVLFASIVSIIFNIAVLIYSEATVSPGAPIWIKKTYDSIIGIGK